MISPAEEVGMLWLSRKIMFHFLNNTWFFYSKNFSVYSLYNWNLVKQHNKNTRRCLGNSDLLVPGCVQAHALGWKDLPQGWRGPALLTLTASSEEEEKSPYCPRTVNVFKAAQNLRPWRRERPGVGDPHGDTGVPEAHRPASESTSCHPAPPHSPCPSNAVPAPRSQQPSAPSQRVWYQA